MPVFSNKSLMLGLALVVVTAGCKSSDRNSSASPSPAPATPASSASPAGSGTAARIDPCKLLTSEELKQVQGEALKEASRSNRDSAEFFVAQCYYLLPTPANSVVVNVTSRKDGAKIPKEFWERRFEGGEEGEAEGEGAKPEKISGIGEEAYWQAGGVGGVLYILKGNVIFRISVGGAAGNKQKLEKSRTLARKALERI